MERGMGRMDVDGWYLVACEDVVEHGEGNVAQPFSVGWWSVLLSLM